MRRFFKKVLKVTATAYTASKWGGRRGPGWQEQRRLAFWKAMGRYLFPPHPCLLTGRHLSPRTLGEILSWLELRAPPEGFCIGGLRIGGGPVKPSALTANWRGEALK